MPGPKITPVAVFAPRSVAAPELPCRPPNPGAHVVYPNEPGAAPLYDGADRGYGPGESGEDAGRLIQAIGKGLDRIAARFKRNPCAVVVTAGRRK